MGGRSYLKLNENGTIFIIPGENPDYGILCGTNVYAVGKGKHFYMIDACVRDHPKFLENVEKFTTDMDC